MSLVVVVAPEAVAAAPEAVAAEILAAEALAIEAATAGGTTNIMSTEVSAGHHSLRQQKRLA